MHNSIFPVCHVRHIMHVPLRTAMNTSICANLFVGTDRLIWRLEEINVHRHRIKPKEMDMISLCICAV